MPGRFRQERSRRMDRKSFKGNAPPSIGQEPRTERLPAVSGDAFFHPTPLQCRIGVGGELQHMEEGRHSSLLSTSSGRAPKGEDVCP